MRFSSRIFNFPSQFTLLMVSLNDQRVPLYSKVFLLLALVYLLSPIDILPDFIPFAGWVDDILLVPALLALATKQLPENLQNELKAKTRRKFRRLSMLFFLGVFVLCITLSFLTYIIFF